MKAKQSETSNLELPAHRVAGSSVMSWKQRMFFISLWLIAASLLPAVRAQEVNNSKPEQVSARPKTVVNTAPAAPTVRTASGVVRGVTEGDVVEFQRNSFRGPAYR